MADLVTGVRLTAFADFVCSVVLVNTIMCGAYILLFLHNEQLQFDEGQRIVVVFGLLILGIIAVFQLWAARVLYDYCKPSHQRSTEIRKWFLRTGLIITWFVVVLIYSIRERKRNMALFSLTIIFVKIYGAFTVAAFIKSLGAIERTTSYTPKV